MKIGLAWQLIAFVAIAYGLESIRRTRQPAGAANPLDCSSWLDDAYHGPGRCVAAERRAGGWVCTERH